MDKPKREPMVRRFAVDARKPIPRGNYKPLGFPRPVHSEPLTPGLRRTQPVNAVGFHRLYAECDED